MKILEELAKLTVGDIAKALGLLAIFPISIPVGMLFRYNRKAKIFWVIGSPGLGVLE